MRMWSFHPKYLDPTGHSRAINEGIAGHKALLKTGEGYPKSWEKHAQLERWRANFYDLRDYLDIIFRLYINKKSDQYDSLIYINPIYIERQKTVTNKQLQYEWQHYLKKIQKRSPKLYEELKDIVQPDPHPIFKVIEGDIEPWERVKK